MEKTVRRDGDESDTSSQNSDLYELSDDSIDEKLGALPGGRSSKGDRETGGRTVRQRSTSPHAFIRTMSSSRNTSRHSQSPKSARRKVSFVPKEYLHEKSTTVPPPEPRRRTEYVQPTPQGAPVSESKPNTNRSYSPLRRRLPKKPSLATPIVKDVYIDPELEKGEDLPGPDEFVRSANAQRNIQVVVDAVTDQSTHSTDSASQASSSVSSLDPAELATPPVDPTRIASRVAGVLTEVATTAGVTRSDNPTSSGTSDQSPTGGLVQNIARRSSDALLSSVTPTVDSVGSVLNRSTVSDSGGSVLNSRSISFGFEVGDSSVQKKTGSSRSPVIRSPSRSPLRSTGKSHHHIPQKFTRYSPSKSTGSPASVWVPPGIGLPRAAGSSPSSLQKKFASDMFASPIYGHGKSPHSPASSALTSASTSAVKAAAAAAQRRFAFAAAVMGEATRLEADDGIVAFDVDECGWRVQQQRFAGIEESDLETDSEGSSVEPRSVSLQPSQAAHASLVSDLRAVALALGEEVSAASAREAARKLQIAAARADAKMASLNEEQRVRHVRRANAHTRRALCRLVRHRVRQWRITASKIRVVRATGKKWRSITLRNKNRKHFECRRADAFYGENLLVRANRFLKAWRMHTCERRGMTELAELAVLGARRARMHCAIDTWRFYTKQQLAERAFIISGVKKAAQYSNVRRFRYVTKSFKAWSGTCRRLRDGRETVARMKVALFRLNLGRCFHSWFGVSQRKSSYAKAVLRECIAEAQLRKALRKMANTNDLRNRIRAWYLNVRERHLTALGHWAGSVAKRSLLSWRALAVAGRRTRARRRTAQALKKIVRAQTNEQNLLSRHYDRESKHVYGDSFDTFDFPTPSPLRGSPGSSEDCSDYSERKRKSLRGGAQNALRDVNGRLATSLQNLKSRKKDGQTKNPGFSRLAKDAVLLSKLTETTERYANDPTTPRRMAMKVGAVSRHKSSAMKPSVASRKIFTEKNQDASPVSFGGYVSPAATRARLWEAPELEQSLKQLAPTVWRTAFQEAVNEEEDPDYVSDEDESAERLLEMARRSKRRVAWH